MGGGVGVKRDPCQDLQYVGHIVEAISKTMTANRTPVDPHPPLPFPIYWILNIFNRGGDGGDVPSPLFSLLELLFLYNLNSAFRHDMHVYPEF